MNETNKTQPKKSLRPSPNALLNPRCDVTFKALFTDNSDEARIALKSFLEAVLDAKVTDIKLQPNETVVETLTDKRAVFDIVCRLNDSETANIEMQGTNVDLAYDRRAEYYAAKLLNHYTPSGLAWCDVPKVFQISVLDFTYDETSKIPLTTYTMRSDDNRLLSDRMSVVFIELPKIRALPDDAKSLTSAEKWGKFLLYADRGDKREFIKTLRASEEGIMAAEAVLSRISEDEANWLRQMSEEKWERDVLTVKVNAERRGRLDGIRQGERNKALETARNAISLGLSHEQISKLTGLPLNEVVGLAVAN